jgi:hypothetical protein
MSDQARWSVADGEVTGVSGGGYFMPALPISSMHEMDTRSWPDSVDALDGEGQIIASLDLDG